MSGGVGDVLTARTCSGAGASARAWALCHDRGMTYRVQDLTPGDRWDNAAFGDAIFITKAPHPLFPELELVVWWLIQQKRYSFDALRHTQELPGGRLDQTDRKANLRIALLEAQQA
jgi:hypothetical protein